MKIGEVKIEELFAATDWCLRNSFPDDYDARCLYSACAIHTILKSKGVKAIIVGGNVGAFTLSADGREALLEGFGGGDVSQPSHYWVEANGVILDPGVSYLPKKSQMSAVSMPKKQNMFSPTILLIGLRNLLGVVRSGIRRDRLRKSYPLGCCQTKRI